MNNKFYLAKLTERSGEYEFQTKFLFISTKEEGATTLQEIVTDFRGNGKYDKDLNMIWFTSDLAAVSWSAQEISPEEFEVLKKYLSVLG